jgi:hypothetical protein
VRMPRRPCSGTASRPVVLFIRTYWIEPPKDWLIRSRWIECGVEDAGRYRRAAMTPCPGLGRSSEMHNSMGQREVPAAVGGPQPCLATGDMW